MSRFRPLSVILLAALLVTLCQPAGAGPARTVADTNWRQYQFDAGHSGNNDLETLIGTGNVATLAPSYADDVGDSVSTNGMAVADGMLYVVANSGLFVYEASGCGLGTCEPLWSAQLAAQVYGPALASGFVFVVSTGIASRLYAFDANGCGAPTCSPLWNATVATGVPMTVSNGHVYTGGEGGVNVFDVGGCGLEHCKRLWRGQTSGGSGTPAVANGRVYAPGGVNLLSVFDENGCGARRCQPLWIGKQPGNGYVAGSPSVVNGIVYVGYGDGMYAFDAAGCGGSECDPLWKGSIVSASATAVANGIVFTQSGSGGHLYAFDAAGCGAATCAPLWEGSTGRPAGISERPPVVANGVVYASGVGGLYAFDAAGCGAPLCPSLWHQHGIGGPAIVVNGAVYSPSGLQVKVLELP